MCGTFGLTMDHLDLLIQLASADWHHKYEDVVLALGRTLAGLSGPGQ